MCEKTKTCVMTGSYSILILSNLCNPNKDITFTNS